jgi:hypothetical protein
VASVARALVSIAPIRRRLGVLSFRSSAFLQKGATRLEKRLPAAPLERTRMAARAHSARRIAAQLAWLGERQALATAQRAERSGQAVTTSRAQGESSTNGAGTGSARANAWATAGSPGPATTRDAREGIPGAAWPAETRRPRRPTRSAGTSRRWTDGRPEPGPRNGRPEPRALTWRPEPRALTWRPEPRARPRQGQRQGRPRSQIANPEKTRARSGAGPATWSMPGSSAYGGKRQIMQVNWTD